MSVSEATGESRFSADRPIQSKKDDLLGRASFAASLSAALSGWVGKDSLVVALYGPWGTGKTSVKNMALQCVREAPQPRPAIIEFNPWHWSGQDQLFGAFFREIGLALGRAEPAKDGRKRASAWRLYAAYFRVGSTLAGGVRNVFLWAFGLLGVLGIGVGVTGDTLLKSVSVVVGAILVLLAGVLAWGGKFADDIAAWLAARTKSADEGLADLKSQVSEHLSRLEKPLVVVLDDIDRLSPSEVKLVFQLVKANGDLPNIVYFLLFDRHIIRESLESAGIAAGEEFLEKIVQVGFDLPVLEERRVQKVLFAELDKLLEPPKIRQRFDPVRWGNIYHGGLRPYFHTLRDVYRFTSMLSLHFALHRQRGGFEVNPIDLIALEVLRVFEPMVYRGLIPAKRALTHVSTLWGSDAETERHKQTLHAILERSSPELRPEVQQILKRLFPPAEWAFGGSRYASGFEEKWFRNLQVCHGDVFDRYFLLAISEDDISQAELDEILEAAGNREKLVACCRELKKKNLLGVALDRLEAYKEKIDLAHAGSFVTAFLDIGDELPDRTLSYQADLLEGTPEMHAARIIYWYLRRESDVAKRAALLKNALETTTGLFLAVKVVSHEDRRHDKISHEAEFLVPPEAFEDLKTVVLGKIRAAAADGTLKKQGDLLYILYRWREWGGEEEPMAWATKLLERDEDVALLLGAFLNRSTTTGMGDYVGREKWYINLKTVQHFMPLETLKEKALGLNQGKLDEKSALGLQALKDALKRGETQEGGPPEDEMGD